MTTTATPDVRDYYRGDQASGISPPDLTKDCSFAEHIVHARGKRTRFTSVSLDPNRIRDFGDVTYRFLRRAAANDGHDLVEHEDLIQRLRDEACHEDKAARLRAVRALQYAKRRREGLVEWKFDISGIERKNVIEWTRQHIQGFFEKA